jgi:DNA uptake protein ComE-like DNA-binding protein
MQAYHEHIRQKLKEAEGDQGVYKEPTVKEMKDYIQRALRLADLFKSKQSMGIDAKKREMMRGIFFETSRYDLE